MSVGEIALIVFALVAIALLATWLSIDFYLSRNLWRVKYPPEKNARINFRGGYSVRMNWYMARDYAKIFNAKVVKYDDLEPPFDWYCPECTALNWRATWHEVREPAFVDGQVYCPEQANTGKVVFRTSEIHIK